MVNPVNADRLALRHSGQKSAGANAEIDPWILWVTFRRWWPWAVPTGAVLAAVAGFAVLQNFVPTYRANHLLEANQDYLVFKNVMPQMNNLAQTEKQLFLNPIVLDPVLADPALRTAPSLSDPETAETNLRKNLVIGSAGAAARLLVSYSDTDREAAAMVCNAIVDSYLRQRDAIDNMRVSNLERWLEPEIQRWEQQVEEKQRVVQRLSEQTLGYAPGQRVAALEDQGNMSLLAGLRSQIAELNVQIAVSDAEQAMNEAAQAESEDDAAGEISVPSYAVARIEPSEQDILEAVSQDSAVKEAQARVQRYKAVLLELEDSDRVRINQQYYQETQDKRDEWLAQADQARVAARERAVRVLNERADADLERRQAAYKQQLKIDRETARRKRETEREALVSRLGVLQQQYDEERTQMEAFGGASAELQFAQEELSVANQILKRLRDRVAAIRTERRQDGAVRTLAAATPPRTPVEVAPFKKMIMASGAFFFIPFAFGLLWEFRIQRLSDSSAVERSKHIAPLVGEIAKLPTRSRSGKGRRIFEESIDSLRANLLLSSHTKGTRSVAVVSSMSGEGKSSVASQLAISIAKSTGKTVLLVDADLRAPDQHEMFGLQMGPGLSGFLAGEATFEEVVDTSLGDLVHVLPAGKLISSPHRLINPSNFETFLDCALENYSFVVVDTAPVLSAGETLAIASAVESTLLCVMRDVSRMDSVTRSTRRLEAAGATIVGTVFSGVSLRQYSYRYGDYHYAVAGEGIS